MRVMRLMMSGVCLFALAQAARAQTADQSGSTEPAGLGEIVVTAQKRSQNLQDVPLSISAFTGDTLAETGVRTQSDLQFVTPGLSTASGQSGYQRAYIRGVGTDISSPGVESPVATYVDGVFQPSQQGGIQNLSAVVERVEVLKGPQGTLYGRNSTGGAVSVITRNPGANWEGDVSATYGNYDYVRLQGRVSGPVAPGVGVLLGAYYEDRDGYSTNLVDGSDLDDLHRWQLFGKVVLEPADRLKVTLTGSYFREKDSAGGAYTNYSRTPLGQALGGRSTYRSRDVYSNFPGQVDTKMFNTSLRAEYELSDDVQLLSISSYTDNRFNPAIDLDGTDAQAAEFAAQTQFEKAYSQELQLTGSSGAIEWVAGAFYYKNKAGYIRDGLVIPLNPAFVGGAPDVSLHRYGQLNTEALAGYLDVTFKATDRLAFTGGFRYSYEKRRLFGMYDVFENLGPPVPITTPDRKKSYTQPNFKAVVKYDLDEINLYAKYENGFKSGVFNITSPSDPGPVPPEKVDSYEIGMKGDFLDHLIRLNLAGYYYRMHNMQLQTVDPATGATRVDSARKGEIKGVEADLTAMVNQYITLNVGANYMETKFLDFTPTTVAVPAAFGNSYVPPATILNPDGSPRYPGGNLRGNQFSHAPKLMVSAMASAHYPVGDGELTGTVNYYHSAKFFNEFTNRVAIPSFDVVNANLRYSFSSDSGVYAEVWGRNILNEKYYSLIEVNSAGDSAQFAAPATYGVTVGFKF